MLTIQVCPSCIPCALCGQSGATMTISRSIASDAPPTIAPEFQTAGPGVMAEVATVHREHLPASFAILAPRVKRQAIAELWYRIDVARGFVPPSDRRPVVRRELRAANCEERAVEFLLAPHSSLLVPLAKLPTVHLHLCFRTLAAWWLGMASWAKRRSRRVREAVVQDAPDGGPLMN